jgi:thiol-disulfide isomerase/thioredoxin
VISDDARLDFEQRIAPLRRLLKAGEDDIFLHRAYQDLFLNYVMLPHLKIVVTEYAQLAEQHPESTAYRYLYARILAKWRMREAMKVVEAFPETAREAPWVHLVRAGLYWAPQFSDKEKNRKEIEKFYEICPASLEAEPYGRFYKSQSPEFKLKIARSLRTRIESRADAQALNAYSFLWPLEFESPAGEHAGLRKQVALDLQKLRGTDDPPLAVLKQGYEITEDAEGARWVREQMVARAPHGFRTADMVIQRWMSVRRRPDHEDSRERVSNYYRSLYEATGDWVKRWPLYSAPWSLRFRALRELPDESASELVSAGEGLLNAEIKNASNYGVPPRIEVAEAMIGRGVEFDRAVVLANKEMDAVNRRVDVDRGPDSGFVPSFILNNARYNQEQAFWKMQFIRVRRAVARDDVSGAEAALKEMEAVLKKREPEDPQMFWLSRPHMVDAYLAVRELAKAKTVLATMSDWLAAHKAAPEDGVAIRSYAQREADYWQRSASLAEAEGRDKDALEAMQKVIVARPFWPTLSSGFAYLDKAEQLWVKAGQSVEDWREWLERNSKTITTTASGWTIVKRALPAFKLMDLQGKQWTIKDFQGKRTFVNFWATWCGPCRAELPHVQKLYMRLKDRADAQVVTLNVDEDQSVIGPFMSREAFAFPVVPARAFAQNELGIQGYPTSWIVNAEGVVELEQSGFAAEPGKWLDDVVARLSGR